MLVNDEPVTRMQDRVPRKTYTPIGCLVAVWLIPAKKTKAGIVYPDNTRPESKREANRFLVIACGPDCKWVKEGDEVLSVNPAVAIYQEGNDTAIIREDSLVGSVLPEFRTVVKGAWQSPTCIFSGEEHARDCGCEWEQRGSTVNGHQFELARNPDSFCSTPEANEEMRNWTKEEVESMIGRKK